MASGPADSDSAPPTVTVLGEAALRTGPDEAVVSITISALEDAPGTALADVANRSERLAEILDQLAIASEDRSTTGVTVSEEFDHTKEGRRSLGHRAVASMSVRLTEADAISRLIMRSSDELAARIAGPSWRISASNPVWLEAATQAAANARAKADAFAAGVDARVGALVALSESEHGGGVIRPLTSRAAASPDPHLEAGEQEVVARIRATFKLESA